MKIYAGMCLFVLIDWTNKSLTNQNTRLLNDLYDFWLGFLLPTHVHVSCYNFCSTDFHLWMMIIRCQNVMVQDHHIMQSNVPKMCCHLLTNVINDIYFHFIFLATETVSISDEGSQGIIWGPLKLTLFIEEVQMYLCFNKRWRLVPSVSTEPTKKSRSINCLHLNWREIIQLSQSL